MGRVGVWLLAMASAAVSLAGCASMDRGGKAAKSAVRQTYFGMGEAVTAPLRDLNLTRKDIPVVLLAAMDAPYQTRTVLGCATIVAEVAALDLVLGPDLDHPRDDQNSDYYRVGADQIAEAALDAVRDAAEGIVPVRSWVRRLSGAQRHEKFVKEAIYAGSVRRAFLKGLGEERGCPHPAAPLPPAYERTTLAVEPAAAPTQAAVAAPVS